VQIAKRKLQIDLNRRSWLQTTGAAAASCALAGCGGGASGGQPVLMVFNWSDYIDGELIAEFEDQASCRVLYDNYSSDAELEARLATGGGAYDVVFPSDRAMQALLAKNLLQPLDHGRLTNLEHIDPQWLDPPCDRGNRHSVAYFWGTVAVGLRPDRIATFAAGFDVLFDPANRGRITMLDDAENVVAATLLMLGLPMNSVAPSDLRKAQDALLEQKPLVQAYTSDAYKERLISGDAWASLGWSGDLIQAADTDFLLDPAIAKRNAEHVHYPTPNRAAFLMLAADDQHDANVYPPPATLAKCQWLADRKQDIAKIEAVWRAVKA